jgi:hypothetical protein
MPSPLTGWSSPSNRVVEPVETGWSSLSRPIESDLDKLDHPRHRSTTRGSA